MDLDTFGAFVTSPLNKELLLTGSPAGFPTHTCLTWIAYKLRADSVEKITLLAANVSRSDWNALGADRKGEKTAADWALASLTARDKPEGVLDPVRMHDVLFALAKEGCFAQVDAYEIVLRDLMLWPLPDSLARMQIAVRSCPRLFREIKAKKYGKDGEFSLADVVMAVTPQPKWDLLAYWAHCKMPMEMSRVPEDQRAVFEVPAISASADEKKEEDTSGARLGRRFSM